MIFSFYTYETDTLCSKLKSDGIEFENEDVIIQTKESLINTSYFKEGLIIAQDVSSIKVGQVVNPKKGAKVLDACSAPGGKSLHMAAIMKNTGSITSCDVYEHKLNKIVENANKLGVKNITPLLADATSYIYAYPFTLATFHINKNIRCLYYVSSTF